MGTDLKHCIITHIDIIDTKAKADTGKAAAIMRELHRAVDCLMRNKRRFTSIKRAYTWNDSVLLLADVANENTRDYVRSLHDAYELKCCIDAKVGPCYAVIVKGKRFPAPSGSDDVSDRRFVFVEASSFAMANCETIPKYFSRESGGLPARDKVRNPKGRQYQWYIDGRIASVVGLGTPDLCRRMELLPSNTARTVHAYDDLGGKLGAIVADMDI